MNRRVNLPVRFWVVGGALLILALILGANAHLLYVAVSSAPDCADEAVKVDRDGAAQTLQPAKKAC